MKKRNFFIPLLSVAFLVASCGGASASSVNLSGGSTASALASSTSKPNSKPSSSSDSAFDYFNTFNDALLSYLGQDDQMVSYENPDMTLYTGASVSATDSDLDASLGVRYAASAIDMAMNNCSTSASSNFRARALIHDAQAYTDSLGSGKLSPVNKTPEDIDLYLANDAFYYNFKGLFLYYYFNALIRANLIAQGYDASSIVNWKFPQEGYYPFIDDDLANYQNLFPLTGKMEVLGAFASPILLDAYGIAKNDFAFSHKSSNYTITYTVADPKDLYKLIEDIADDLDALSSSSSASGGDYDSLIEAIKKLEPIFEATTINKFQIVLSFTSQTVTASSADIDLDWNEAAIKKALAAVGQDGSTYPQSFKLSGSATYDYGDRAVFTLPDFSDYDEVKKPNKSS